MFNNLSLKTKIFSLVTAIVAISFLAITWDITHRAVGMAKDGAFILAHETADKYQNVIRAELQETRISKPTAVELQATQIPKQSKAQLQGAQFDHDLDVEQLNIPLPRQSETELQGLRLDQEQIEAPQGAPRLGQHTVVQATTPSDPWEMLREILTSVEVGALRVIESKQSLTAFALEQGIMGEVLIEGINEKAMDCIGDMLLEMDEEVMIYEDYLPFLGKITHS